MAKKSNLNAVSKNGKTKTTGSSVKTNTNKAKVDKLAKKENTYSVVLRDLVKDLTGKRQKSKKILINATDEKDLLKKIKKVAKTNYKDTDTIGYAFERC